MLPGYYSGISGMYYNEQKLGVVANNLSNVNTNGFRHSYLLFRSRGEEEGRVDRDVRRRSPQHFGMEREGVHRDFSRPGNVVQTGNPLDVAIPSELPNAYIAVRRAGGTDGETYYTRNGTLSFGPLNPTNPNSPTVLHVAGHIALGAGGAPINVDPSDGPIHLGTDGQIFQNNASIGELPIYRLDATANPNERRSADLAALEGLGDSLFKIPPQGRNRFFPHAIQVGQAGINRVLMPGSLERSNVKVFEELQEMILATKGVEANRVALEKQMDGLTKLFQIVRR